MPKRKPVSRTAKILPNVDLNYEQSDEQDKQMQVTEAKHQIPKFTGPFVARRQKVLQFLGGNQMPKSFNHRTQQVEEITNYIQDCISKKNKNKYKILMVTGSPGAGKSLSVTHILTKFQNQQKIYKVIKFNANIIKTVKDVHDVIATNILDMKHGASMSTIQIIRHLEQKEKKEKTNNKYIIYIEEVQIILQQKTNIFTEDFFSLFSHPKINIMMIGISNTIDALAKYSKNIAVNLSEIKNIVFKPYPIQNIVNIMKEKLQIVEEKFGFKIIITEKVFNFVAAKIQNTKKGDVRIVLEFLRELANTVLPKKIQNDIKVDEQGIHRDDRYCSRCLYQNALTKE